MYRNMAKTGGRADSAKEAGSVEVKSPRTSQKR
jgi:hypothetical protein